MTIIKRIDQDKPNYTLSKKLTFFIGICMVFLIIAEIWINNSLITYGVKMEKISVLEKNLRMENQILQNEIAKKTSLVNVATESAKLGFSSSEKVEYIR